MAAIGQDQLLGLMHERQRWTIRQRSMVTCVLFLTAGFFLAGVEFGLAQTTTPAPSLNGLNPALQAPRATIPSTNDNADDTQPSLPDGFGLNQRRVPTAATANDPQNDTGNVTTIAPAPRQRPGTAVPSNAILNNRTPVPAVQDNVARTSTVQGPGNRTADPDPFTPLGLRKGKFILRPSIESSVGFTTNSINAPGGDGSVVLSTEGSLIVDSDFARHAVGLNLSGGVDRFLAGVDPTDFNISLNATARLDVNNRTAVNSRLGIDLQEDDVDGVSGDPLQKTLTAGIGVTRTIKELELENEFRIERDINGDFTDNNGVLQSQDDQNSTLLGFNLRGTLNRQAVFRPFAEIDVSREIFDVGTDVFGNKRTATALRGTVGLVIDRGEKLNGEIGIGYQRNFIASSAFPDFGAFVADFNLNWSPRRLTTITLNGSTTLDSFPSLATSGDTTYDFNVAFTQQLRENLTATIGSGLNFEIDANSRDTDTTWTANFGLAWSLNRVVSLTADYNFSRDFTADGAGDFTTNTITIGIRAER